MDNVGHVEFYLKFTLFCISICAVQSMTDQIRGLKFRVGLAEGILVPSNSALAKSYRGTSLLRNRHPVGPCLGSYGGPGGGGGFL